MSSTRAVDPGDAAAALVRRAAALLDGKERPAKADEAVLAILPALAEVLERAQDVRRADLELRRARLGLQAAGGDPMTPLHTLELATRQIEVAASELTTSRRLSRASAALSKERHG